MNILLIIISLFLDGIFSAYISSNSYFLPLLTISAIYITTPIVKKNATLVFFITGLIYDLMYTTVLPYHAIMFVIISKISRKINKNLNQNIIKTPLYLPIIIIIYESITFFCLTIFKISSLSVKYLINTILQSLILNVIYAIIINLILQIKTKKS